MREYVAAQEGNHFLVGIIAACIGFLEHGTLWTFICRRNQETWRLILSGAMILAPLWVSECPNSKK
jgi:hypothetical protein